MGIVFLKKKKNKKLNVIEYKLLFKQDTFQAAKMTFTELNMRILTEKENLFNNLAQPFL